MVWQAGNPPGFETERLILRALGPGDVTPEYVSWWNNPDLQEGLGHQGRGWDHQRAVRHIKWFDNKDKFHFGIYLKEDKRLVGFYSVINDPVHKVSKSTTLIADKSLWRKGLALEISRAMMAIRFNEMGIEKIEGKVRGNNTASKSLYEKLGFKKEGVLEKHGPDPKGGKIDITLYGLLKGEWRESQKAKKNK